jgi:integrase/recombinase XerD
MVNRFAIEETSMSHPFCPNPVVWQQLYTGPLGPHIDTFAQQLLTQGYASWTAKSTMRLLADLSRWLQRQAFMATDLNEPCVDHFLQDRYQHCRPHREDHPIWRRLLEQWRDHGVIAIAGVETDVRACDRIACDVQHYLLHQRGLAPTTVRAYLDTVRRFLSTRVGAQPLRLAALGPHDITDGMLQQTRRYSPARAKLRATALRSLFHFLRQRGAIANDLAPAVPTVPNGRLSGLPRLMKAEDVEGL